MRISTTATALVVAGLLALGLSACGSDDPNVGADRGGSQFESSLTPPPATATSTTSTTG